MSRTPPADRRRRCTGFSLIEVVVALAVLAVTLVSVGGLVATAVRGTRALEDHLALIETARAIATGLPSRRDLLVGNLSGAYGDYRWRIDRLPLAGATSGLPPSKLWVPQQIVIEVRAPSGSTFKFRTVRLLPRVEG